LQACDDATIQIIGVTCKQLENIDIWKSTNATDAGIRMFLGVDAKRPFKVCSTLKKIAIKDTSITGTGAFNMMIHWEKLDSLEFSQDSFLPQLLWRISETILQKAPNLESVQASGSPSLNDSCMVSILSINPLSKLKRLVISHSHYALITALFHSQASLSRKYRIPVQNSYALEISSIGQSHRHRGGNHPEIFIQPKYEVL
jgi:hypothetical protein